MKGEYVIIKDGERGVYSDWNDIQDDFDHVISFLPDWPQGPHTEDEHAIMATFNGKLQELMEIERARSNQNR